MNILAIDTSGKPTSVALMVEGEVVASKVLLNDTFSHAETLLNLILRIMKSEKFQISKLDNIVFCSGPGSYTGLRIGLSVAKGCCFAYDIPLYFVNTLEYLTAVMVSKKPIYDYYVPLIDARRMEVYTAVYNQSMKEKMKVRNLVLNKDTFDKDILIKKSASYIFFGEGTKKIKEFIGKSIKFEVQEYFDYAPEKLIELALISIKNKKSENINTATPFYIKPVYTTSKK